MKWAIADTRSLDDVLAVLAAGRKVFALEEDAGERLRLVEASTWLAQQHTLGAYRPTDPLNPHFPDELVNRCPEMEIML
jgi:hypothetical protein